MRKILIAFIILLLIPINTYSVSQEDLKIHSKNAVIFDRKSKTVIWGKDEQSKVPMASTTKIMTAVILLEKINDLEVKVEVVKQSTQVAGSRLGLKTGDKITYNDLLYGLMLCSGNDAATQIAISVGGSVQVFINMMNEKAKELGLKHTRYVTPHGLDNKDHYTTALELAKITDYALEIKKFAEVVSTKTYMVCINGYYKTIRNTNELLGNLSGVNGVKTGFTNGAGRCLVTSVNRNDFNIITVVLGANTKSIRTSDSIKLIENVYKNYELVDLKKIVEDKYSNWGKSRKIIVLKGEENNINTKLGDIKYNKYPVLKGEKKNINVKIRSFVMIKAPIYKDFKIGEIKVATNTAEIMSVDILNAQKITKKTVFFYIKELFFIYNKRFISKI